MCHVFKNEWLEQDLIDEHNGTKSEHKTVYHNWRLDYNGVQIKSCRMYTFKPDNWRVLEYTPMANSVRHGWCTNYFSTHKEHNKDLKAKAGYYKDGKRVGTHISYGLDLRDEDNASTYIHETSEFVNGSRTGETIVYESHGTKKQYTYTYRDDILHGVCIDHNGGRHKQGLGHLYLEGRKAYNLAELHIDHKNITEADIFTMTMLGL